MKALEAQKHSFELGKKHHTDLGNTQVLDRGNFVACSQWRRGLGSVQLIFGKKRHKCSLCSFQGQDTHL